MEHFAITGITAGNKSPRRDVDTWFEEAKDPKKFPVAALQLSLFTRALQRFQDESPLKGPKRELSYYRIAGIHGWPMNLGWDGIESMGEKNKTWNFCVHGTTTFPTWHRPYLALYEASHTEQLIYGHMKDIIAETKIPQKTKHLWNEAADEWRLPYWDYARKPEICEIASLIEIEILNPEILDLENTKLLVRFKNPMYSYKLNTGTTFGGMGKDETEKDISIQDVRPDIPSSKAKGTSRWGIKSLINDPKEKWIEGYSDNKAVSDAFSHHIWNKNWKASGTIAENVYKLLTKEYFESWRTFASTKYYKASEDARSWLSLESVHNMAHIWSGGPDLKDGTGHMAFIELSAFDPIFWLHHNFIDMILATWQTRTGNQYWFNDERDPEEDEKNPDPTGTDPLPPFHNNPPQNQKQRMFSSNDVQDFSTEFNYTYDLLVPNDSHFNNDGSLNDKYYEDLASKINDRYSTTRSEMLDYKTTTTTTTDMVATGSAPPDYIINVIYDKHALGEPYSIHLFAGPLDERIVADSAQPNRLGTIFTFSRFNPQDTCLNCKDQIEAGDLSTGQITITGAMIKDVEDNFNPDAENLTPSGIETYLQRFLSWKIVTVTGREVPPQDLPKLKITLFVGHGQHSTDDTYLSTYKDYKPLYAATAGKPGGATEETGCY